MATKERRRESKQTLCISTTDKETCRDCETQGREELSREMSICKLTPQ